MQIIESTKVIYGFQNEMEYNYKVNLNEEFVVETNDCFFQQISSEKDLVEEIDANKLNPATGPIFVEGAEIGDILKIDILDIIIENKGVSLTIPNGGVLGSLVKKPLTKIIDIEDNMAILGDIRIPIKPMIGVIGLATSKEDGFIPTSTPFKHGGNLDTKEITAGTSLYLPVRATGGLLALGDLHAVMGDGELCFTGLEIPGKVKLKLSIIKNKNLDWPLLETDKDIMIISSNETMEKAMYDSTSTLVKYISNTKNIEFEEAYILSSLAIDVRVSQVVNPLVTLRAAISKDVIGIDEIIDGIDKY